MSFCKVGEKAYLRVNNSEVWRFDGPITVNLREEQDLVGKTVGLWEVIRGRPDSLQLIIYGFDSRRATVNRTQYECRFVCGNVNYFLIIVKGRNFADSTGRNVDRFFPIGPDGLRTWTRGERGDSTVYGEAYPTAINWVVRPHNPNETVLIRYFLEVRNPTTGQLLLDRPYGNVRPTYTVRCGDKCPPGTTWNERCKACVCDDMGAIKAGLRSATAIARSIK